MIGFKRHPSGRTEISINLRALYATVLVVGFVFAVCGVFGAWR